MAYGDKRRQSEIIRERTENFPLMPSQHLYHRQAYTLSNRLKEIGETEQLQTEEVNLYGHSKETGGKVQQSGRKLSN